MDSIELTKRAEETFLAAKHLLRGDPTPEDVTKAEAMIAEANTLESRARMEKEIAEREIRLDAETNDAEPPEPVEPEKAWRSFGEFIQAVRFNPAEVEKRQVAQEMSIPALGGFLVPPEFVNTILRVDTQNAIVRPRATVIPSSPSAPDTDVFIPTLDYSFGRYAGVAVTWIDEGEEKPDENVYLERIHLTPYEVAARIHVTDRLLRNAGQIEGLIGGLLRDAILAAEDDAFLNGTGAGMPMGVITAAGPPAAPTITVARAGAGAVTYADIVAMYASALPGEDYVWVCSPTVIPELMSLTGAPAAAGVSAYIWQQDVRGRNPGTLLGYPVLVNERSPVLGAVGDIALCAFKHYVIKDGFGIAVAASEHRHFELNITVIKAFFSVDGMPWLQAPIVLEDGVTNVSPFVVLSV